MKYKMETKTFAQSKGDMKMDSKIPKRPKVLKTPKVPRAPRVAKIPVPKSVKIPKIKQQTTQVAPVQPMHPVAQVQAVLPTVSAPAPALTPAPVLEMPLLSVAAPIVIPVMETVAAPAEPDTRHTSFTQKYPVAQNENAVKKFFKKIGLFFKNF